MQFSIRSLVLHFNLYVVIIALLAYSALAQTVTLVGPANTTVADADEYFSDVWGAAKNFNDTCDIGWDGWGFEPEAVNNGVWTGTHPDSNIPVIGFVPIPTLGSQLAYREDCGRLGLHYPINAAKYTQLTYKIALSMPNSFSLMWAKTNDYALQGFADYDGYLLDAAGVPTAPNAWSIKDFNMPARAPGSFPWSGNITGISLWPSLVQTANGTMSMDWFRLYDPNNSPSVPFSWNTVGQSAQPHQDRIMLYVDNNNSGYDGTLLKGKLGTTSSLNYKTGGLAPGTYYFYARLETDPLVPQVVAQSNYVGPLHVNGKPDFVFRSPTRFSGPEYSRNELGNAWDMSDAADVVNTTDPLNGYHNESFHDGVFEATTDFDLNMGTIDTKLLLNVPSNKPINTNFYRYFCYRMQVNPLELARNGDVVELNRAGWVGRLIYVKSGVENGQGSTGPHELIERSNSYPNFSTGFTTFCLDMWDDESWESGPKWRDLDFISVLRFDPLEAADETPFMLDWAGVFAENENSSDSRFKISWTLDDPEDDPVSISLYYDTDGAGYNGTLITTRSNQTDGNGAYNWNTSAVPTGTYYIYAILNDGTNTKRFYAPVPVHIRTVPGVQPPPAAAPCDFDGDGRTDPTIVRAPASNETAAWFVRQSTTGTPTITMLGSGRHDIFVGGDFDGDRVTDETYVRARIEPFVSWLTRGSAPVFDFVQGWGLNGDIPVMGDIDGDNKDDFTVWRPNDGSWWSIRSQHGPITLQWGLPGDYPITADYDGDKWDDLSIFRPQDGTWWILQSTRGASRTPWDILFRQWGLPGDHPMPGDYDGDGKADIVVWRPSSGHWFICHSSTNFDCSQPTVLQFGLPGDMPISADFDGDGIRDPAVFRPNGGWWFYRQSSDSQIQVIQWGLPGDIPVCQGIADTMTRLP